MKKVIVICDGTNYSTGAFAFAHKMNELEAIHLTGLFVPSAKYIDLSDYTASLERNFGIDTETNVQTAQETGLIQRFKESCVLYGIEHTVHADYKNFTIEDLKLETRYADLLLIGGELFYGEYETQSPNAYIRQLLHESECAILIVPEACNFPEKNILTYDGRDASVYAIKQFAYLFNFLTQNETILLDGSGKKNGISHDLCYEFIRSHYAQLTITAFEADVRVYFTTWVSAQKNAIIVAGAYGRSVISELLKKSFITETLKVHQFPIFISHR